MIGTCQGKTEVSRRTGTRNAWTIAKMKERDEDQLIEGGKHRQY